MALNFGTISNNWYVDYGTLSSANFLSGTLMALVNFTVLSTNDDGLIIGKHNGTFGSGCQLWHEFGGDQIRFARQRTGAGCAAASNVPVINAIGWHWVAAVWDSGGVDGDQKIYAGDLGSAMVDETNNNTIGTGGVADITAASFNVGADDGGSYDFEGHIACAFAWDGPLLTLAELNLQAALWDRVAVQPASCVLFSQLGWNGTGTQVDWSGNRHNGTVTGATLINHAPLGFNPPARTFQDFGIPTRRPFPTFRPMAT